LLSSAIYASQRQLAARVALPDDKMRLLLTSLSERGGKLSARQLAQRLSLPEIRLGGLLSAVRRMLNVDQAPVLTVDEAAGTVELNVALLHQQFRVPAREANDDQCRTTGRHRERPAARHRAQQRAGCAGRGYRRRSHPPLTKSWPPLLRRPRRLQGRTR
jgi:hypothetical protein